MKDFFWGFLSGLCLFFITSIDFQIITTVLFEHFPHIVDHLEIHNWSYSSYFLHGNTLQYSYNNHISECWVNSQFNFVFVYKYSPLPGFEPWTTMVWVYEAPMCHRASVGHKKFSIQMSPVFDCPFFRSHSRVFHKPGHASMKKICEFLFFWSIYFKNLLNILFPPKRQILTVIVKHYETL